MKKYVRKLGLNMHIEWRKPQSCPFFLVSSDGKVMVADTMQSARIADNGNGYMHVQIMRNCKRYTKYVHRLVAECYLDNPENKPEINHKDGDKKNNNVTNLEWCTRSENQKHSFRIGLHPRTTEKQREAARKNGLKSIKALRAGWERWSKTPEARESWMAKIEKINEKKRKGGMTY